MRYYIGLLMLLVLLFSGCTITGNVINEEADNGANVLSPNSSLENFYGKPSIILFGGTYCGHCQQAVPIFKEKVYDVYSDDVNIWINVIDGKKFNVEDLPQGLNTNLNFNAITKSECRYIPSWVILDETGEVALSSCGGEKEMSDMIKKIDQLLGKV